MLRSGSSILVSDDPGVMLILGNPRDIKGLESEGEKVVAVVAKVLMAVALVTVAGAGCVWGGTHPAMGVGGSAGDAGDGDCWAEVWGTGACCCGAEVGCVTTGVVGGGTLGGFCHDA